VWGMKGMVQKAGFRIQGPGVRIRNQNLGAAQPHIP
jgi:hypothetical protein